MHPTRLFPLLATALLFTGCASDQEILGNQDELGRYNPRPQEPLERTDALVQVTSPEMDVLFVVDNSCSMADSQDELARNFPIFLNFFVGSGVDYHIGVVSTDMTDPGHMGKLRSSGGLKWIDEDTPNPDAVFAAMAQLGTNGASVEQGIAAAYTALELRADGYNEGFRRDTGGLMVVAISDEQDQSGTDPVSPAEFAAYLNGIRDIGVDVSFSSIVRVAGFDAGTRYISVTQDVGGITWDITSQDWEPVLEQLGIEAMGLRRTFYLSQLPVESSISVEVHTGEVVRVMERDVDWFYEPSINAIEFYNYVPDALSKVEVTYVMLSTVDASWE